MWGRCWGGAAQPSLQPPAQGPHAHTAYLLQLLYQRQAELPGAPTDAPGYVDVLRQMGLDYPVWWPLQALLTPARTPFPAATCSAPKTFQSCNESSENTFGAACAPTCQMLATGTPCVRLGLSEGQGRSPEGSSHWTACHRCHPQGLSLDRKRMFTKSPGKAGPHCPSVPITP